MSLAEANLGWGAVPVCGVLSLAVSLESREVDKPSPPSPEAQAGSQAAAGLGQASSGGEEAGEAVCPAAGWASALLPRSSCLLAQRPHRQTRLVRAGGLQGELSSSGSKASLWREGPPRAAAPAAGTDRAQPLCQHTAPALTWGQQDRGSCLQEAGVSSGRGCPGPSDGWGWVWSVLPRPRNSSQTWPWRVLAPGLTQAWGGGVVAGGLIKKK